MKTCYLHIGSEKTGTTSIQKFFAKNRDELLLNGFWYPRSAAYPNESVHRRLSDHSTEMASSDFVSDFEREVQKEQLAGAHTAIISSEFFHSRFRRPEQVAHLHALLTRFFDRIEVIYYARRQDKLIVSMHSTAVRSFKFTASSALPIYESKGHHYFDHLAVCNLWAERFGRENLTCRIYEPERLLNGDVIDDLSKIIGLRGTYQRLPRPANESLSAETLDMMLLLNRSSHADSTILGRRIIAIGRERGGPKIPTLTRPEAETFLSRFKDINLAFFSKYVDPQVATEFQAGFKSYPDRPRAPITAEAVMDYLLGALASELDAAPGRKHAGKGKEKKKWRQRQKQTDAG